MKKMSMDKVLERVEKMRALRDEYLSHVEDCHVKLQGGNSKTGKGSFTVSLVPILDCQNCAHCMGECYDVRNDCRFTNVIKDRAKNSAIHKADPVRFWREIDEEITRTGCTFLRGNVGGDYTYDDMIDLSIVAIKHPECKFLFFTKNYDDLNKYLDEFEAFPKNVACLVSRWHDMPCENRHNMPESHVLYSDGTTTAPEFGSYLCTGDCTACNLGGYGCPHLKRGEHVTFLNH